VIFGLIWQDIAISFGASLGVITLLDGLVNDNTTWPLRSSLTKAFTYVPSAIAFYTLDMYLITTIMFFTFSTWMGIAIFRRPDSD
jgi:uncharacterized membrane protein YjjP (DUF1212 family)